VIFLFSPSFLLVSVMLAVLCGIEMRLYDQQSVWSISPRQLSSAGFLLFILILFNITVVLFALLNLSSISNILP